MRLTATGIIVCFVAALAAFAAASDEEEGKSVLRDSLYHMRLSDGSLFSIGVPVYELERRQTASVSATLYAKDTVYYKRDPPIWQNELTSVDYVPGTKCYYALVRDMEDRIFIFCMWSGQHFTIDKKTGRTLKKDEGDDVLKEYADLVPLKLGFPSRSTGHTMTEKEAEELENMELEGERQASAIFRSQSIPGSKVEKSYVIQFDKAESKRHPLVVIVWKASRTGAISLYHLDKAVPAISINGHSVTPPPTKKAIYALQPDYSLQQLSLTEEEITPCFRILPAAKNV